ncbi:MAG TPA: hypothetical protein VNS12_14890 [Pelagibacterium sp.]|uniref:hypothetical protein n=1 Tax=Pelagibacterium sp. TaxID=1967288 RepID=UPI002D078727|nr:hypothetical protein [Pelagibacterium sp.]HWJ89351.1 hypothetical protein [Pelagibacterium sp.]
MEPRLIVAALAILLLTACTTAGSFCEVSAPIRPSTEDHLTEGTARQLLVHNQFGATTCGWRP